MKTPQRTLSSAPQYKRCDSERKLCLVCRPRWLMGWTGADELDNAADRTTARRVCAAGRA